MSAGLWLAVAGIGGAGALGRFLLDAVVSARSAGRFPVGTLAVNLTGSFVLGVLVGTGAAGDALLLAGPALIGSFTTFSTWMYETQRLAEDGDVAVGALNLVASLALGLGAAALGRVLGGL